MKKIIYLSVIALIAFLAACEKDEEPQFEDQDEQNEEQTDSTENNTLNLDSLSLNPDTSETVSQVDLQKYLGLWYEVEAIPQSFQSGCTCTTAEYIATQTDTVTVINACNLNSPSGQAFEFQGTAVVQENTGNSKLLVRFFNSPPSDYWIIDLSPEYEWAVVGSPTKDFFWILSRERTLDTSTINYLKGKWGEAGYDMSRVKKTPQDGCS
jgi:apolipoprotein D and lipocalin family protein